MSVEPAVRESRPWPILAWLQHYDRRSLRYDLLAGLTVWALVVPQAIAYAQIAGLPPQAGVFCAFAAPLGYALLGTSRQLIVSPTSATAALSASMVAPLAANNLDRFAALSALLAITSGIVFILLGYLKLGFVSQFIATSVQTGFLFGLGLTIMIGQFCDLIGIDKIDEPFYRQFWHVLQSIEQLNGWTAVLGISALAIMFGARRLFPDVPTVLPLAILAILIVAIFSLDDHGVAIVGHVDRAVPMPVIPTDVNLSDFATLLPGTLAIAIIGYSESISVSDRFANKHKYEIAANQEMKALGTTSLAAGLFQGFIASGGASQTAANDRAGARTQMASVILAVLAGITAIALLPYIADLPIAVLAAVVISAVVGFINVPAMRRMQQLSTASFVASVVTLVAVLLFGILPGLLIAVGLSIIRLIERQSRPTVSELGRVPATNQFVRLASDPDLEQTPSLMIVRLDAPLLFLNATTLRESVRDQVASRESKPEVVVLDLEFSLDFDVTGLEVLGRIQENLRDENIAFWLAGMRSGARERIARAVEIGAAPAIPSFRTVGDAVAAYNAGDR